MHGGTADGLTNCFSVPVAGVNQVTLRADSDGTQNCDSAAWGELKVCAESDASCSYDAVLPVAIACSDYSVQGLLSPGASTQFCSSACAALVAPLMTNCPDGLPETLKQSLHPIMTLLQSGMMPAGCGTHAVHAVDADLARQCQQTLATWTPTFRQACCTSIRSPPTHWYDLLSVECAHRTVLVRFAGVDGNCDPTGSGPVSQGFIPQTCTESCERIFTPFFSDCGEAIWGDSPEEYAALRDLARICTHGGEDITGTCDYLGSDVQAVTSQVDVSSTYGVDGVYVDVTTGGQEFQPGGITIGGHRFLKGIFAHASSSVAFSMDPSWRTVSGCAGIALMCGTTDNAVCPCTPMSRCVVQACGTFMGGPNSGAGQVTFSITAGSSTGSGTGARPLWTHSSDGDDGMSCFEIPLDVDGDGVIDYDQLIFAVDSDGPTDCDTAAWGDLKACRADDACADITDCQSCRGGCGWCTGKGATRGRCSADCVSNSASCAIGGGH